MANETANGLQAPLAQREKTVLQRSKVLRHGCCISTVLDQQSGKI